MFQHSKKKKITITVFITAFYRLQLLNRFICYTDLPVIHVKLFLDHFGLKKSQADQELTNTVTRFSHNYKGCVYKVMFYQHNMNVTLSVAV